MGQVTEAALNRMGLPTWRANEPKGIVPLNWQGGPGSAFGTWRFRHFSGISTSRPSNPNVSNFLVGTHLSRNGDGTAGNFVDSENIALLSFQECKCKCWREAKDNNFLGS